MNLSDALTAAMFERVHFLCTTRRGRVTWLLVAFNRVSQWDGERWGPLALTAEQIAGSEWTLGKRGPRTKAARKRARAAQVRR